jgi:hypothetical protein
MIKKRKPKSRKGKLDETKVLIASLSTILFIAFISQFIRIDLSNLFHTQEAIAAQSTQPQ